MQRQAHDLIQKMDLNLLRLFVLIYQNQSLTKTAEQLFLSQSAISHALNRLRLTLNDELFYKEKGKLYPTTYAQSLYPTLAAISRQLQQTFSPVASTDDRHMLELAQKRFQTLNIAMHDEVELIIFNQIFKRIKQYLPECQFVSSRLHRQHLQHDLRVGKIDLAFDVAMSVHEDMMQQCVMTDHWVVAWFDPNLQSPQLTAQDYLNHQHITVSSRRTGHSLEDSLLAQLGVKRQIQVRCQHYATACQLLAQGNLLLTLPMQMAQVLIPQTHGWHRIALPLHLPQIAIHGYWHSHVQEDLLHQWLRKHLL